MYEDLQPRFVKQYANLGEVIRKAVGSYIEEVKAASFLRNSIRTATRRSREGVCYGRYASRDPYDRRNAEGSGRRAPWPDGRIRPHHGCAARRPRRFVRQAVENAASS